MKEKNRALLVILLTLSLSFYLLFLVKVGVF